MARKPNPWYRKQTRSWYVSLEGKQINLGNNKKQAEKLFHELMARPERTIRSDSVVALIDLFLDWTSQNRNPLTYEWYLQRLTQFANRIPTLPVYSLKAYHVQKWIDTKRSDGHKRGCITAVQRAMNWAVRQGYIEKNPIDGMEKPPAGTREFVVREDLFQTVLHHCYDQEFRDLIVFSWESGARPQETFAAEARHYDSKKSCLHFPKEESKGKKRPRFIFLTDPAHEIVSIRAKNFPQGKLFRNAIGNPWNRNNVSCRFTRMRKHLGQKLCLYNFRHSFGTRMLESGVDSLTVAALMGHADLSMLGRVYAHLSQNPGNLLERLKRA